MNLIQITPCKDEDLEALSKVASADGHAVIAPTYLIQKDQQIVGYIGVVPSVLVWLDSQRTLVRDSIQVMNFWENILRATSGASVIGVPCTDNSPLKPFLPRVGYVPTESTMYLKRI